MLTRAARDRCGPQDAPKQYLQVEAPRMPQCSPERYAAPKGKGIATEPR
jgi:hypothetical protein